MSVTVSVAESISATDVLVKIIKQGDEGYEALLEFISEQLIQFQGTLLDRNEAERYYVGFDDDGALAELDMDRALFKMIIRRDDGDVNIQVRTEKGIGEHWFKVGIHTLSRQAMRAVADKVLQSYRNFWQFAIAC